MDRLFEDLDHRASGQDLSVLLGEEVHQKINNETLNLRVDIRHVQQLVHTFHHTLFRPLGIIVQVVKNLVREKWICNDTSIAEIDVFEIMFMIERWIIVVLA